MVYKTAIATTTATSCQQQHHHQKQQQQQQKEQQQRKVALRRYFNYYLLVCQPRPNLVLEELLALVQEDFPSREVGESLVKAAETSVVVGQGVEDPVGGLLLADVAGGEEAGGGEAALKETD